MRSNFFVTFLAVILFGSFSIPSRADVSDWQVVSLAGRDYLTLENVARFYQLRIEQDATDHHYRLADRQVRIETCKNPREIMINGVKHWLSFPTLMHDGQLLVTRFDLAKVIEPSLRPTMIGNLEPFSTVVLDAGHGGQDGGGKSVTGLEKQYTLEVIQGVKKLLEAKGFKVVLTRYDDVYLPLEGRADFGNHVQNSIFVSVHFNSSGDASANGFEVFAMTPRGAFSTGDPMVNPDQTRQMPGNDYDDDSFALATCVHHSLLGHLSEADRGVKRARFAVLRLTHSPAILIEGGFLTNGPEGRCINDPVWRQKLADAIAIGIKSYRDLATFKEMPKLVSDYKAEQLPAAGTVVVNSVALASAPPTQGTAVFQASNSAPER